MPPPTLSVPGQNGNRHRQLALSPLVNGLRGNNFNACDGNLSSASAMQSPYGAQPSSAMYSPYALQGMTMYDPAVPTAMPRPPSTAPLFDSDDDDGGFRCVSMLHGKESESDFNTSTTVNSTREETWERPEVQWHDTLPPVLYDSVVLDTLPPSVLASPFTRPFGSSRATCFEPVRLSTGHFTLQGARNSQEDSFYFDDSVGTGDGTTYFAGVYDGHNGALAASMAAGSVHKYLKVSPTFPMDMPTSLVDSLRAVDKDFHTNGDGSGTTALCACVHGRELTVANLGDCRAILVMTDGRVLDLTEDHKPSSAKEMARISAFNGNVSCGKIDGLGVSRGLGDFRYRPELSNVADVTRVAIDDSCAFVLLATDGLWDKMTSEEAGRFLFNKLSERGSMPCQATPDDALDIASACSSPHYVPPAARSTIPGTPRNAVQDAVAELVQHAVLSLNSSDNVTAICIKLH